MGIGNAYLQATMKRYHATNDLGEGAIDQLTDVDLNWPYDEASNRHAVIVEHLSGNMTSRWTD